MNAYSQDLREKIVQALFERGMGKSEVARTFGVSLSSVKRYAKAVREGRSLSPGKAPGKRALLDEKAKRLLWPDPVICTRCYESVSTDFSSSGFSPSSTFLSRSAATANSAGVW
jgi:hypothetical protein